MVSLCYHVNTLQLVLLLPSYWTTFHPFIAQRRNSFLQMETTLFTAPLMNMPLPNNHFNQNPSYGYEIRVQIFPCMAIT